MNKIYTYKDTVTHVDPIGNRLYMVGSLDVNGVVSFSSQPVYHASEVSAKDECIRLAKSNPGKNFMYVRILGGAMLPSANVKLL